MKASSMQNHFDVTRSKCRQTKPIVWATLLILKCKQLYNSKYGHQLSVSQQPVPDYEDVHHTMHSLEHDRHTIELKENVAYGPIELAINMINLCSIYLNSHCHIFLHN